MASWSGYDFSRNKQGEGWPTAAWAGGLPRSGVCGYVTRHRCEQSVNRLVKTGQDMGNDYEGLICPSQPLWTSEAIDSRPTATPRLIESTTSQHRHHHLRPHSLPAPPFFLPALHTLSLFICPLVPAIVSRLKPVDASRGLSRFCWSSPPLRGKLTQPSPHDLIKFRGRIIRSWSRITITAGPSNTEKMGAAATLRLLAARCFIAA